MYAIPKGVELVIHTLRDNNFEAHIVGGCVRDLLQKREPVDWDVTTSATPDEVQRVFDAAGYKTFYENDFGTVGVIVADEGPNTDGVVEVTTYRAESGYSDSRRPDEVQWVKTLEEDLARRDFTVNAMALDITDGQKLVDPFGGEKDNAAHVIRAVGDPAERFQEDALRLMRAVRFATVLGEKWQIEEKTKAAIADLADNLATVSKERVRDELVKMIMSPYAASGIELMRELNLLQHVMPELLENYGVPQNKHHVYDCYEHAIKSLEYAAQKDFNLQVRLAALFHDIAKPRVKAGEGEAATFYNHEVVGAKMTTDIMRRLKFPKADIVKVSKLVRYHLFYYNVDEVGESSVRRLVTKVGLENIDELLQLRHADRIGSGVPKAEPYKLRHLRYMIEKVSKDPVSVSMLKVSGADVMKQLDMKPGPRVGWLLSALLELVLDDPKNNTKELLVAEAEKLGRLSDEELKEKAAAGQQKLDAMVQQEDEETRKKYWVK